MAVVDELVTILGIKLAADALGKLNTFKEGIAGVTKTLAGLGVIVTGAATAAGFFIKGVVDEAAELDKLSQKTGISTDALQEWQYAAQKSGVDAKAVTNDLVNLQKTMSSPIPGQFNATMAMFGVSARDASGKLKTTDQLLGDMAGKFQNMSQQKAAQWASKLGISDDTLLLLRQGKDGIEALRKEAHKLGGVIPSESIKKAAEFKKQLAELQFALKGITSQVAIATLPAISKLVQGFKDFIESNREWISLGLEALMGGIVNGFERFFAVVKQVFSAFGPLADTIQQFLPEMDGVELVTHLVTGALTGLLVILSPLLIKIAAVGAAVVAASIVFEDFFTYLEGGDSVIGSLFDAFAERWPDLFAAIQKVGSFIKDNIIVVLEVAWDVVKAFGSAFADVASQILDGLNSLAGPVMEFFSTFQENFPALTAMLSKFAEFLKTVLVAAFEGVIAVIKTVIDYVFKVVEVVGGALKKILGFLEWVAEKLGFIDKEAGSTADKYKDQLSSPALPGTQKVGAGSAGGTTQYNDNKEVNIQIATNDPMQAGQQVAGALGANSSVNTNTPGQFAPRAF